MGMMRPGYTGEAIRDAIGGPFEVSYYEPLGFRWVPVARYPVRADADAKAHEIRLANLNARVLGAGE